MLVLILTLSVLHLTLGSSIPDEFTLPIRMPNIPGVPVIFLRTNCFTELLSVTVITTVNSSCYSEWTGRYNWEQKNKWCGYLKNCNVHLFVHFNLNMLLETSFVDENMQGVDELYLCTSVPLPDDLSYIVGFEPMATMTTVHHMLLYACDAPGLMSTPEEQVRNSERHCLKGKTNRSGNNNQKMNNITY